MDKKERNRIKKIITRADYLNGKASFSEYYSQFLDDKTEDEMLEYVSIEDLKNSKDEHLNDIPLNKWDGIFGIYSTNSMNRPIVKIRKELSDRIKSAGEDCSVGNLVCIYKQQARKTIANFKRI